MSIPAPGLRVVAISVNYSMSSGSENAGALTSVRSSPRVGTGKRTLVGQSYHEKEESDVRQSNSSQSARQPRVRWRTHSVEMDSQAGEHILLRPTAIRSDQPARIGRRAGSFDTVWGGLPDARLWQVIRRSDPLACRRIVAEVGPLTPTFRRRSLECDPGASILARVTSVASVDKDVGIDEREGLRHRS